MPSWAQAPQPSAPSPLSVVSQSPSPEAKAADKRAPIELVFEDPKGEVDPSKVTMSLDGADVTGFLEIAPGRVRYAPPSDLPAGRRSIRISLKNRAGQPLGDIEWGFVIKRFPNLEQAEIGLDISANYQVATNKLVGTDPRHQTNANTRIAGRAQEEGWIFTLNGNARYQDEYRPRGPSLQGDKVDVPDYQLSLEKSGFQLQMGNLVISESQLAAPSFGTRGVQGKVPLPFMRSEIHAFVARSQLDAVGNHNRIGFEHGENRMHGASLIVTPFIDPQMLRLHGVYNEGDRAGSQKRSIEGGQRGQSWTLGGASNLFEGRVKAEVENSWARFDGFLGDFVQADHDEAARGLLQWTDQLFSIAGDAVRLAMVGVYDRTGTRFRTITNPGVSADREGFNINTSGAWRFVNVSLGGSLFNDNIELLKAIPRTTSSTYMGTIGLNPPALPTLSLNYMRTDQISSHQPAEFGPRRIDNDLHRFSLTSGYGGETWNLNFSGGVSLLDNKTVPRQIPDNRTYTLSLGGGWRPSQNFNLGPSISFNQSRDKNRQVLDSAGNTRFRRISTDSAQLSLATNWNVIPQELTLDLQESFGMAFSDDNAGENLSSSGSIRLAWNVEKYLLDFGKQVLSLRSTYNWRDDKTRPKELTWGFFVALDVFFPVKF